MALNLVYPSPAEMSEIEPDLLMRDRADRIGLKLFPVVPRKTFMVRWTQMDNYYGLQQFRGLDGSPPKVSPQGESTYVYEPGVYGEHAQITEREMLTRSAPMRPDLPIDISDLVLKYDNLLIVRQDDRMEANIWNLMATGTLSIPMNGPNGVIVYKDQYTIQQYTTPIPWLNASTATPILNLQTVQQFSVGHGVDLGAGAVAYMNRYTANLLLGNSNTADFAGKRDQYGATLNNVAAFNNYFQNQGLPQVVVYDEGYQLLPLAGPETNPAVQFQKFIPNHIVIIVGKRPNNAPVGEYQETIQAMNPGGNPAPGEYRFIKNYASGVNAPIEVPPRVEIHRGHNGGPAIYYPSAVVAMTV